MKGRDGAIRQAGEYYWINEAVSEERYQGFHPTDDEQWQRHFDAGLPIHGETWNRFMTDFIYQGSFFVV